MDEILEREEVVIGAKILVELENDQKQTVVTWEEVPSHSKDTYLMQSAAAIEWVLPVVRKKVRGEYLVLLNELNTEQSKKGTPEVDGWHSGMKEAYATLRDCSSSLGNDEDNFVDYMEEILEGAIGLADLSNWELEDKYDFWDNLLPDVRNKIKREAAAIVQKVEPVLREQARQENLDLIDERNCNQGDKGPPENDTWNQGVKDVYDIIRYGNAQGSARFQKIRIELTREEAEETLGAMEEGITHRSQMDRDEACPVCITQDKMRYKLARLF